MFSFSAGRLYNPFLVMKASFMLVVSVLYGKIFELLYQKQHITIENERLKNENLQTQYNMLANQISPHFLFNSLNSLSMLVREGQNENAQLYIDRLADTFRYMLRSGRSELATLSEEARLYRGLPLSADDPLPEQAVLRYEYRRAVPQLAPARVVVAAACGERRQA